MDRIVRKEPQPMAVVIKAYLRAMHLVAGHNTQRVFIAWDKVTNAGKYTSNKFFKDGILYVTVTSSVLRSHLLYQLDYLVKALNDHLMDDELFIKDDPQSRLVTKIILK